MKTKSLLTVLLAFTLCAGAAQAEGAGHAPKRDANGDGSLSLEEFLTNRKNETKAKARFEKADTNQDGQLDKAERVAFKKEHKGKQHCGKKHRRQQAPKAAN